MLYTMFEWTHVAVRPARAAADGYRMFFNHPLNPMTHTPMGRQAVAACEVFERTTRRYDKPTFGLPTTVVDGATVDVREEIVWQRPFCRLVHFKRDVAPERAARDPRILIVAPMSGHFATLLRGTVEAFLPNHEVYITDWQDARDVPLQAGNFDLDDYVDTMGDIFRHFGGDVHVYSVCQPSVAVLAAIALMEAADEPHVPLSVTMAGGPIDTRRSPTVVNDLAVEKGTEWFRRNVLTTVPWTSRGAGRRVYPGFLQLSGFMTMNLDKHMTAHKDLFLHLVHGDGDSAEKHREFYDEYLAVMDLTAEFYMQTIDTVFVNHRLPKGEMMVRGKRVDLTKIRRVALMTIEGEKDDITGIGQCAAAIDLCTGIPAENKQHFECPKVGHYGLFNGSRFRTEIAPRMARFMRRFDPRTFAASELSLLDEQTAVARARGHKAEFAADAFSFAADNDAAVDRVAEKVRSNGLQSVGMPFAGTLPFGVSAQLATMRMWGAAGYAMLGSMTPRAVVPAVTSAAARIPAQRRETATHTPRT